MRACSRVLLSDCQNHVDNLIDVGDVDFAVIVHVIDIIGLSRYDGINYHVDISDVNFSVAIHITLIELRFNDMPECPPFAPFGCVVADGILWNGECRF